MGTRDNFLVEVGSVGEGASRLEGAAFSHRCRWPEGEHSAIECGFKTVRACPVREGGSFR